MTGRLILLLFFLGKLLHTPDPTHAFYVSITEIEWSEEWGEVHIKVKIFTNDLEDALEKAGMGKLYLNSEKEMNTAQAGIFQYLNNKMALYIDQEQLPLSYVKRKYLDDACWIYLKAGQACQVHTLGIKNKVLLELFDTQTNIIRLKTDERKEIANLDKQIFHHEFSL